jgi:dienelactone hydrolase
MIAKTIHQKVINILRAARLIPVFWLAMSMTAMFVLPAEAQDAFTKETVKATEKVEAEKINPGEQYLVRFKARLDHDFLLSADYRFFPEKASAKNMAGVIVLHDCQSQWTKYKALSTSIAEQGLHTLSLDFRGYGNSVAQGYSHLEVKKNATDIVSYQNDVAVLKSYWAEDLLAAYEFLRSKVDKSKGISIVASGCAGAYAVALAEKVHLNSLVLLTPEMSYADKERYKNLIDIPSYFISSAQHAISYATAQELFTWNGAKQSKLQVYKGDKLNYQIIKSHKYLVNDIALWLKFTLR